MAKFFFLDELVSGEQMTSKHAIGERVPQVLGYIKRSVSWPLCVL